MVQEVIFWGATGQAKVLRECLSSTDHKLVALFDNNPNTVSPIENVPIFHGKEGFEGWKCSRSSIQNVGFLVAIGGHRGEDRVGIQHYLESAGLVPMIAKHSTATISDSSRIGAGSQILARALLCVETQLGTSCIINVGALINHECKLGNGVHVSPGAILSGLVEVDDFATIYTGAIVCPRLKIGRRAIVGAGAVVLKDVPDNAVVVGNPARYLRENQ